MAETLSTLSLISFIVAAVFLVIAAFLWFAFGIPGVIGDLTGKTQKRSIEQIRAASASNTNKKTSGFLGKKTSSLGKREVQNSQIETGVLNENKASGVDSEATGLLDTNATELLDSQATGMLDDNATALLDSDATGLLIDDNTTGLLVEEEELRPKREGGMKLEMIEQVILIHTREIIK